MAEPDIQIDEYDDSDNVEDEALTAAPDLPTDSAIRAATSKWARRQKKRDWLAEWALYLAKHRGNIGYRQYRPVNIKQPLSVAAKRYVTIDCSSMVEWLFCRGNAAVKAWGGLPDPGGYRFSGYGNTYSQEPRGHRVNVPSKGDLAFYNGHVAIVVHANTSDPRRSIVVSHGSQSGPLILPANYRRDLHGFRRYF